MSVLLAVEVAYGLPRRQCLIQLEVPVGATMHDAVRASGLLEAFPEIDLETAPMGIFSVIEPAPATRQVQAGDRVEIYRPLQADPKEARKARARKSRQ